MTPDELMAGLAPSRLPPTMLAPGWPEYLALLGLGLLAGVVLVALMRPFLRRRLSRAERIRQTRGLPAQERILAIARILGRLPESLRPAAYGAVPPPPDAEIERIARRGR
ncbi:hypothetical protein [Paracoccus laeviglucosivorans]|uniref:Uncharacterized protein n=1 Tax=Paracoccus laeviglucosivorans TaxID=1197861 RepID=A0A521B804_9RHOB|nr:hypothetical protein [Paracoccus laeviglucosivorans]SMO43242.1 hypothetical protein SAMN06265221_102154 [Paracoccus laeviglucosivorans]